jgi:integrase
MSEKRIKVWVQKFKDRPMLMLQWIDPETGKRKSKSAETSDPDKAEAARVDHESDLNAGRYAEASKVTWDRFRELYEEEFLPGKRSGTRGVHRNTLDQFEKACTVGALRSINERTISAFVSWLRKQRGRRAGTTMMESTIALRLEFLHTALAWAKEQGSLARVPKFPKIELLQTDPAPVATESFERLYAKADGDPQLQAFMLCGWLAGLRRNEALALEWEETDQVPWVDLARNRIWLPAKFVKGKKDRWVPLDPELRQALLALPRHGQKVLLLANARGGERLSPSGASNRVVDLAKKAGVRLSMKSLRSGFGCRYAGKVPAQVLQKLMRHSDIKITMKYYANVDDAVEAAVLGDQRNTLRNSGRKAAEVPAAEIEENALEQAENDLGGPFLPSV